MPLGGNLGKTLGSSLDNVAKTSDSLAKSIDNVANYSGSIKNINSDLGSLLNLNASNLKLADSVGIQFKSDIDTITANIAKAISKDSFSSSDIMGKFDSVIKNINDKLASLKTMFASPALLKQKDELTSALKSIDDFQFKTVSDMNSKIVEKNKFIDAKKIELQNQNDIGRQLVANKNDATTNINAGIDDIGKNNPIAESDLFLDSTENFLKKQAYFNEKGEPIINFVDSDGNILAKISKNDLLDGKNIVRNDAGDPIGTFHYNPVDDTFAIKRTDVGKPKPPDDPNAPKPPDPNAPDPNAPVPKEKSAKEIIDDAIMQLMVGLAIGTIIIVGPYIYQKLSETDIRSADNSKMVNYASDKTISDANLENKKILSPPNSSLDPNLQASDNSEYSEYQSMLNRASSLMLKINKTNSGNYSTTNTNTGSNKSPGNLNLFGVEITPAIQTASIIVCILLLFSIFCYIFFSFFFNLKN